ncbi:MAG: Stf0 family sulfotransferase [Nannocystaceae bacterium]
MAIEHRSAAAGGRPRFVLLASPRCGSTTLSECLALHSEIDLLFEPFHPDAGSPFAAEAERPLPPLDHLARFDAELARIFARHDGIKHVLHQLSPLLARRMLRTRGYRVIFLWRRNRLRQAVSNLLAFETAVWHAGDGPWPPAELPPLDVDRLAAMIAYYRDSQRIFRAMLRVDGVDHLDLAYEDLFEAAAWAEQRRVLDALFCYVGRRPLGDPAALDALRRALDPRRHRLNSPALYREIPNWRSIERRLASADDGSLVD